MCHCRSPGYGLTLVSETTAGVLHSAELFSNQPLAQGSEGSREPHPPSLPEDIGRQTALLLIQEIVNVNIYYIDIMYGPNVAYLLYRGCQTIYIPMLNVICLIFLWASVNQPTLRNLILLPNHERECSPLCTVSAPHCLVQITTDLSF